MRARRAASLSSATGSAGTWKQPKVAWELLQRWQSPFGEMAVPLGPQGLFVGCQVERVDGRAALPAIVVRRLRSQVRIGAVRDLSQPLAAGVDCVGLEHHRPG